MLVIIAGVSMGHQHSKLVTKNNSLILQNDSILSVNLRLSKEITKLQSLLDSIRLNRSSVSRLRIPN
jgi:hypothetical protein